MTPSTTGISTPLGRASREKISREPARITVRAVFLGVLAMAGNSVWVTHSEIRWYALHGSFLPLFVTPIFFLFLLAALNLLWARLHPRSALSRAELLTVYLIIVVGQTLAGADYIPGLFGQIGHAHWMATPENRWADLFHDYLPQWLVVSDSRALQAFYSGGESLLSPELVGPFLAPLAAWGVWLILLVGVMLGINVLLAGHWTDHEKLAYPLVILPLALTRQSSAAGVLLGDKFMWVGFGIAALINLINGLNVLYPVVPALPGIKMQHLAFTAEPWSAMYQFWWGAYPFAVGLAFFLPADLLLSGWFFALLSQGQSVLASALGMRQAQPEGFPYLAAQGNGAWLALAVGALWLSRGHLQRVWRAAWEPGEGASEAGLYRGAWLGTAVGLLGLVVILHAAGLSLPVAVLFLFLFYLISVGITRVRAEFGAFHEIFYVNPERTIVSAFGAPALGPQQLTTLAVFYWFHRLPRCHPMPNQLEGLKMASAVQIPWQAVAKLLLGAALVGIVVSYAANLDLGLREGAMTKCIGFKHWVGGETYSRLSDRLYTQPGINYSALAAMAVGAAVFFGLRHLHFHTMLPLHPAGHALALSFAMNRIWFSFLVSWLIKVSVLRYGGRDGHRIATRIMLGLVLGDYVTGSVWSLLGVVLGREMYKMYW